MATTEDFKIRVTAQGIENLDKISKGAENAEKKINNLAASILGVSFGAFIAGALDAADRISDLSDATGISIVNLKSFQDALETSGGKAKNVERAILGFSQSIETAADGSDKMREAFAKVGVSLTDLKNLSEQDLLQKTIQGLDELKRGGASASEVASTGSQLLTKAFRGVDVSKFFADFESGKITLGGVAQKIKEAADANGKLEGAFRNLQLGALEAINPILKLFGEQNLSVEAATKLVTLLGVAIGVSMGAAAVANILAIAKAVEAWNLLTKSQIALQFVLGALQDPKKVVAYTAAAAAGYLAAQKALDMYDASVKENEKTKADALAETQKLAKKYPAPETKDKVDRKIELSASQKAAIESEKRFQQSIADIIKSGRLATAREEEAIQINADSDIAKARAEIFNKEGLSEQTKLKEFIGKSAEIQQKATLEIAKFRREQLLKTLQDEEKAREENGIAESKAMADRAAANAQAFAVVNAYRQGNEELIARAGLQKSIVDLGSIEQERATKLFEVERDRIAKIKEIQAATNNKDDRLAREQELNKEIAARIGLINQEYDTRQAREQDYSKGFKDVMKRYEESFTPIKQGGMMAESVFSNMNSAIDNFATTGKFKFGDFAKSIIQDMIKIELKAMASSLLRGLLGSLFGGSFMNDAGGMELAGSLGFANGGNPPVGRVSIVGERGPELFVPRTAGTIIPNHALGGGGTTNVTNVTYSIQAVDASSFRSLVARDPSFIYAVTEAGRRSQPSRRLA
jgi:lambda family phage tail tape measure protein